MSMETRPWRNVKHFGHREGCLCVENGVCTAAGAELQGPKSLLRSAKQPGNWPDGGRGIERLGSLVETGRAKGLACHRAPGNHSKAIMSQPMLSQHLPVT